MYDGTGVRGEGVAFLKNDARLTTGEAGEIIVYGSRSEGGSSSSSSEPSFAKQGQDASARQYLGTRRLVNPARNAHAVIVHHRILHVE